MDQNALRSIIEQVLIEMNLTGQPGEGTEQKVQDKSTADKNIPEPDEGFIPDVTEVDIRRQYLVQDALHKEEYAEFKYNAPCRYIGYRCTVGMPEARRTVVSNIHGSGTLPVEAGAHIADIIKKILENKASGTDLKL